MDYKNIYQLFNELFDYIKDTGSDVVPCDEKGFIGWVAYRGGVDPAWVDMHGDKNEETMRSFRIKPQDYLHSVSNDENRVRAIILQTCLSMTNGRIALLHNIHKEAYKIYKEQLGISAPAPKIIPEGQK